MARPRHTPLVPRLPDLAALARCGKAAWRAGRCCVSCDDLLTRGTLMEGGTEEDADLMRTFFSYQRNCTKCECLLQSYREQDGSLPQPSIQKRRRPRADSIGRHRSHVGF